MTTIPSHLLISLSHADGFVRRMVEASNAPKPAAGPAAAPTFGRTEAKVAVIRVVGALVHREEDAYWSGCTSYETLGAQIAAASDALDIAGILLVVDSPGGMVAGAFDLTDAIAAARAKKPVVAFVQDCALSAGYLIASAADEIVATQTGYVGSIGVVVTHVDLSKMLEAAGIVVTHMHAGARKVDGSPYAALSPEARAQYESFIERDYGLFLASVERGRDGSISADVARATEAAVFTAQDGLTNGLCDAIGTQADAFERLAALIGAREASQRSTSQSSIVAALTAALAGSSTTATSSVRVVCGAGGGGGGGSSTVFVAVSEAPAVGAAANHQHQEDPMDPKDQKGGAEVIDFAAEIASLKAALAKSNALAESNAASLKAVKAEAKIKTIETAQLAGKITGTNLAAVSKLAELMEGPELEAYLAELPVVTSAKARGIVDAKPKADSELVALAARLGMSAAQVEAFDSVQTVHLDGTCTLKDGSRVLQSSINTGRA